MIEVKPLKEEFNSPIECIDDLFLSLALTLEKRVQAEESLDSSMLDFSSHLASLTKLMTAVATCDDTMGNP